jgi:hypothetical protein
MSEYNFDNLSPYDFELLIRDLLQSAEDIKLRSFAPGRDRGIDLHGWESRKRQRAVIVQCKHMMHSPWANIRTSIKGEKAKLDRLKRKPDRYILAMSKSLTAQNIDELFEILQPYCLSTDDIIDAGAIEQLLGSNEAILHRHYKLWITSTPILRRVLQAGIYTRSEFSEENLLRKSRTFVQPDAFSSARGILKDQHSCIISGLPGVGKTTLAEMLCLEYLAQDFELIAISADVSEGDNVYAPDRKQVFIYDDFLGRTGVEKLRKNEDNRIVEFIRRVHRSPSHRFILTTREYILRAAQQRYERLDTGDLDVLKCVVEMDDYTSLQKGLILYQHLAFSEHIAKEEIEDLVRRRLYHKIVEHPNYTPRHITDALNDIKRRRRSSAKMPLADDLLAVLDDPTHMWSHALRELSQESQRLFLTLPLLPKPISMDDLQIAYSTQSLDKSGLFLDSLRALEDSFISISEGTQKRRWISFRNPSLQDFAQEYLNQRSDWLDGLLGAPAYYEQIAGVYELAMTRHPRPGGPLYTAALYEGPVKYAGIQSWVIRRHNDLLAKAVALALSNSTIEVYVQSGRSEFWAMLKELIEIMLSYGDSLGPTEQKSFGRLIEKGLRPVGKSSATTMFELLQERRTGELIARYSVNNAMEVLRSNILDKDVWKFTLLSMIDEWLEVDPEESLTAWGNDYMAYVHQIVNDLSDSTDGWRLDEAIREIDEMAGFLGLDLDDSLSALQNRLDDLPPEREEDYEGYGSDNGSSGSRDGGMSSLRQLDNVFGSLLDFGHT